MVGMKGLEPIRSCLQRILSPLRLPIPPHPHLFLEVPIGFEPMITELQSVALPLGQGTVSLTVLTYYTTLDLKSNKKSEQISLFFILC